jgi:hypothetical protein
VAEVNRNPLEGLPGGSTATGYTPSPGLHVICYRLSDGTTRCGWVEDNRLGLFLRSCHRGKIVLTAALWNVRPMKPTASCLGRFL